MFEREDWTLFRNTGTLGQKAGVPLHKLAGLVVKELCDNALDTGTKVSVTQDDEGWIFVDNEGPGMGLDAVAIANIFSIRRPLTSSKLIRVPSRGALGNGLRVVSGAVLASRGELYVETDGIRYVLTPQDSGETTVTTATALRTQGTRVALRLGASIPVSADALSWAKQSIIFATPGKPFVGKTSAWWYDSESFFELCKASGSQSLGGILKLFREKPTHVTLPQSTVASTFTRETASQVLHELRVKTLPPKPVVLGKLGDTIGMAHAESKGEIKMIGNDLDAVLPFHIDAYLSTREDSDKDSVLMMVNRTPITGEITTQRQKGSKLGIIGCGLGHAIEMGRKPVFLVCNITIPYMPVTTDGKEPDLFRLLGPLAESIERAAARARRKAAKAEGPKLSQRAVIVENLAPAIDKASGSGVYRYSLRQLFYAVRPYMLDVFGKEPDYNYFAQVITDVEAERGEDLPGLYRDARGTIYHPHTGQEIPLGTLNVEKYSRPDWTFNKVLYSEKEGFFSILKDAGWPERNDCALLTSKGFASRAARDVIDLIGSTQEDIYFFCIHDADASGTLIYQALTEATRARAARKVHVINLGLDPWEALDMGLQVEKFRESAEGRSLPVADYVGRPWSNWLQTQRVELNAMSSPQFIAWLDEKFAEYADKIVPPAQVLQNKFEEGAQRSVERLLAQRILAEAGFSEQVEALMQKAQSASNAFDLDTVVREGLQATPTALWSQPLAEKAEELAQSLVRTPGA